MAGCSRLFISFYCSVLLAVAAADKENNPSTTIATIDNLRNISSNVR